MSFISTFEELSKLYESVEPEVEEKATEETAVEEQPLEESANNEAIEEESEELDEGIFDSKATKQKKYEQEVNDVFKAPSVRLASEVSSNASRVIERVANEMSAGDEGSAAKTSAKNVIRLLKAAIADAKGKTPLALVRAVISIGTKYEPDATGLDELKEFASKVLKLSDPKVRQYLMEKVNAAIERSANQTIAFLKKEHGITESLEEAVDAPEDETVETTEEPAEEAAVEVEARQVILECSNCGGLVIKDEADVIVDEESDLANVEDACQYCEEAVGYKIVGVVAPYEVAVEEVVEDAELEEGIFNKKPSAEQRNMRMDFDTEVERLAKRDLNDIAYDLSSFLRHTVTEFRILETKENKDTDKASLQRAFEAKAEQILKIYEAVLKSLKTPNNFGQAGYVIASAANKILGSYTTESTTLPKIDDYYSALNEVNNISADKKVKQMALKDFFAVLSRNIASELKELKALPTHTLFKESLDDGDQATEDELEEIFNANTNIDLSGFGGQGNDVSVLSGGIGEELDEDQELDELFNANLNIKAPNFGGTGNDVGIL